MDEEKKKINDDITVIRAFCIEHEFCSDCPISAHEGDDYFCDFPYNWENIE